MAAKKTVDVKALRKEKQSASADLKTLKARLKDSTKVFKADTKGVKVAQKSVDALSAKIKKATAK